MPTADEIERLRQEAEEFKRKLQEEREDEEYEARQRKKLERELSREKPRRDPLAEPPRPETQKERERRQVEEYLSKRQKQPQPTEPPEEVEKRKVEEVVKQWPRQMPGTKVDEPDDEDELVTKNPASFLKCINHPNRDAVVKLKHLGAIDESLGDLTFCEDCALRLKTIPIMQNKPSELIMRRFAQLANRLDACGAYEEADELDGIIKSAATHSHLIRALKQDDYEGAKHALMQLVQGMPVGSNLAEELRMTEQDFRSFSAAIQNADLDTARQIYGVGKDEPDDTELEQLLKQVKQKVGDPDFNGKFDSVRFTPITPDIRMVETDIIFGDQQKARFFHEILVDELGFEGPEPGYVRKFFGNGLLAESFLLEDDMDANFSISSTPAQSDKVLSMMQNIFS